MIASFQNSFLAGMSTWLNSVSLVLAKTIHDISSSTYSALKFLDFHQQLTKSNISLKVLINTVNNKLYHN